MPPLRALLNPHCFLWEVFHLYILHAGNLGRDRAGFNWIPDCPWALMELSVDEETEHSWALTPSWINTLVPLYKDGVVQYARVIWI